MPLYEYRCNKCDRRFSLLVGVTAEKAKLACPRCGSTRATKLISRIASVVRADDFDDFGDSDLEDAGEDFGDYEDDYDGGYDGDLED